MRASEHLANGQASCAATLATVCCRSGMIRCWMILLPPHPPMRCIIWSSGGWCWMGQARPARPGHCGGSTPIVAADIGYGDNATPVRGWLTAVAWYVVAIKDGDIANAHDAVPLTVASAQVRRRAGKGGMSNWPRPPSARTRSRCPAPAGM
jgi:hypothetical protein